MTFLIAALMVLLLIRLLSILYGGPFKKLDHIIQSILSSAFKKSGSSNRGSYGGHSAEKSVEQQQTIRQLAPQLDMFELNRLQFEHIVDSSINRGLDKSAALHAHSVEPIREIVVRICDQVFIILDQNANYASLIQELLSEINCASYSVPFSISTSHFGPSGGITLDPRAAISRIREHIQLSSYQQTVGRQL